MRKVKVFKNILDPETKEFTRTYIGEGFFHQFGMEYDEYESGPAAFSIAIVEMEGGEVMSVPADYIVFEEPPEEAAEDALSVYALKSNVPEDQKEKAKRDTPYWVEQARKANAANSLEIPVGQTVPAKPEV